MGRDLMVLLHEVLGNDLDILVLQLCNELLTCFGTTTPQSISSARKEVSVVLLDWCLVASCVCGGGKG